jgi:NifU-like protein involved in Fe-S cluster formation
MERTVSDHVSDPRHAAALDGADAIGEAWGGNRLLVRVGVWHGPDGRVLRARYRSTTCASLIAFAEVACDLLERGAVCDAADAGALAERVRGVHPGHLDRAGLVSAAVRAAVPPSPEEFA